MSRKRLLVVSHACVTPVNQLLFAALQREAPDLDITLLIPSNWRNDYTGKPWTVEAHPAFTGTLRTLPVWLPWHISLHVYRHGIGRLLTDLRPDWIYLDEEPWALVTQQIARINHRTIKAPFFFHTNQNLQKRYPFPFSYFEQWVYRHAGHALPVGEEAAQVLRNKGYANPLTVFPYGIDEQLYTPSPEAAAHFRAEHGLAPDRVVFGFLGRFVEEKGLPWLMQAFVPLVQAYPQATLCLIGGGPEEGALNALANQLGLSAPAFVMVPSIRHQEAPIALSAFQALMLPSLTRPFWKEQFGRVIIEALACGTPVIGSDSGEIPHLLRKLGGGPAVPEGNVAALTDAMRTVLEQPETAQTWAETGRRRVLDGYTNAQLARGFHQVLQGLE